MKKQVSTEHYDFIKYITVERWVSYYNQIFEVCKNLEKGSNVLLIGVGDAIVSDVLKKLEYNVKTFDFDSDLNPDIVGDVTEISDIINEKYDAVICCQVLEHIPFEQFENIICKIKSIIRSGGIFILSLPDSRTYIQLSFRLLGLNKINLIKRIKIFWRTKFRFEVEGNNEHYWELGTYEVSCQKVRSILKKHMILKNEFVDKKNLYHHFYILLNEKNNS